MSSLEQQPTAGISMCTESHSCTIEELHLFEVNLSNGFTTYRIKDCCKSVTQVPGWFGVSVTDGPFYPAIDFDYTSSTNTFNIRERRTHKTGIKWMETWVH